MEPLQRSKIQGNSLSYLKKEVPQKKSFWTKKRIFGCASFLIICATFVYIMNHQYLQVSHIRIEGQRTLVEDDFRLSIERILDEKYFGIIPRSNILFVNPRSLQRRISEENPKIKNIDVDSEAQNTLVVSLGERRGHSLWCVDKEYLSPFDEECYFSDELGYLYARAPYFSGNVYLKIYQGIFPDTNLALGTHVLPGDFQGFFNFIDTLEKDRSMKVFRIRFVGYGDVEIELSRFNNQVYTDPRPVIRYNNKIPYEDIISNLELAITGKDFQKDFTQKPTEFESLDLRFGDRIFYTFKPEVIIPENTNTTE